MKVPRTITTPVCSGGKMILLCRELSKFLHLTGFYSFALQQNFGSIPVGLEWI